MSYERVRIEPTTPVARLTMSWAEKRNALSLQMMEELIAGLTELGASSGVRAIILGAQGNVFSAGHYLPEMIGKDLRDQRHVFDTCVSLMETVQKISQPVVAEVPGVATAAGCQLVATCDLAVAVDEARFATPGVKIGLFCTTPMVALSRAVGRKRAMEMLLTGEFIDAGTARDWGLVNYVVPREALRETAERLAAKVAEASSLVVALGKQAFYSQIDLDQGKAYQYAKEVMSMNALALDAQEGMSAFLEKRPPSWQGR
ncbi:MAG TPA: enoyl-CoA hydratase [Vicinamibacteria bacterium]|nr:enoyl-CoA hydratase [Vicinamibacteria bacterium]